eukprot:g4877.t1
MDDILIHTRKQDKKNNETIAEVHLKQLKCVLHRLSAKGMSLKAKKTRLLLKELKFLGHIINKLGLKPNPDKVKVITEAQRPTSRKQLRSWLGLVGYYRNYIKNHSSLCFELRKLDKDNLSNAQFNRGWGKAQDEAFDNIKKALTSAKVMLHPDPTKPFIIHVDGSYKGVGATLNQKDEEGNIRPVWYASRSLTPAEANYDARELECLALLWSLEKWRHFLPNKVKVVTDHSNLLKLKTYVKHKRRLIRWACRLSEYNISLKHRKGKEHIDADHTSRMPQGPSKEPIIAIINNIEEYHIEITSEGIDANILAIPERELITKNQLRGVNALLVPRKFNRSRIKREQQRDTKCKHILNEIKEGRNNRWTRRFEIQDGILMYTAVVRLRKSDKFNRLERRQPQIVTPASMVDDIIRYYHHEIHIAHSGLEQTVSQIRERFYWRTMRKDVAEFISTCEACVKAKTRNANQPILVNKSVMNEEIFGTVFMDFTTVEADNDAGYKHILTMLDEASSFILMEPTQEQTSRVINDIIYKRLICQMGKLPYVVVMDNGMLSTEVENFLIDLGIAARRKVRTKPTAPHNPQANKVERMHSELKKYLRTLCYQLKHQAHWPELIQPFAFQWNSRKREKLGGYSPFELIMYDQPELSIERMISPYDANYKPRNELSYHSKRVQEMFKRSETMRNAQQQRLDEFQRAQDNVDHVRQPVIYKKGDWVIRREKIFGNRNKGISKSLSMKWSGPHRIIRQSKTKAHVYHVRFASGREERVPEHLLKPISDQTRFRENEYMRLNYVNPDYVAYDTGNIIAFKPTTEDDTEHTDPAIRSFRLGEILEIIINPENEKTMKETYKVHVYGTHNERVINTRAKRLKMTHKPLYKRHETRSDPFISMDHKQKENNSRLIYTIEAGQLLNIPPLQLTANNQIKAKDRQLINAYFRDYYADARDHAAALARKREKKKRERQIAPREKHTRMRRKPERYRQTNAINLMPQTLIRDQEELTYYLNNTQLGDIARSAIQRGNIYDLG